MYESIKRSAYLGILNENKEVEFNLVVKGEYCETKEMMIKNYFAKLVLINFDTIY